MEHHQNVIFRRPDIALGNAIAIRKSPRQFQRGKDVFRSEMTRAPMRRHGNVPHRKLPNVPNRFEWLIRPQKERKGKKRGEAENGADAVAKYRELTPDLVTLDITMPEMDGLAALKEIRSFDSNAKIIMCSAMGQQAMVIDAIQAGAKDFIVKPFNAERVIEAVSKTVAQ